MSSDRARKRIVGWYARRAAEDQAALADIRGRYKLQPARSTDELLAQLSPEDATAVREIMSHAKPGADAIGFDLIAFFGEPGEHPGD
jgi:hypothetical protein